MVHPTAIIDPRARLDPGVEVGPYVVIDGPAEIAVGCRIEAHAQIVGHVIIGEGTCIGRAAIIGGEPQDLGFKPETDSGVQIGARNVIRELATIHRSSRPGGMTRVGDDNFIMAGAHLAHDCVIGNQNVIANAALLAGHVSVGSQTFIGGGAVFHQFLRIGDSCVVQGNSGFSKDIPHFCAAQRINRLTGLNVVGLRRQGFNAAERAEIKELFALIFNSGLNLSQAIVQARQRPWSARAVRLLEFVEAPSRKGICPLRSGDVVEEE